MLNQLKVDPPYSIDEAIYMADFAVGVLEKSGMTASDIKQQRKIEQSRNSLTTHCIVLWKNQSNKNFELLNQTQE